MSRRTATEADLKIGTIVFRGNGQTQFKIWRIDDAFDGVKDVRYYMLQTLSSKSAPASKRYRPEDLQVVAEPVYSGWTPADDEPVWNL